MSENNKIICPTCNAENAEGKKFCMKCGSKLQHEEKHTDKCPECGADWTEGALFCGECGYKLEVKEPEPVPEPEPVSSTVICPSCGAENSRDKKFCLKCGTALTPVGSKPAADKPAVKREPPKAKAEPVKKVQKQPSGNLKKLSPKLLAIIAAAVVVVVGAIIGIVAYNSSGGIEYDYQSLGFNYHIKATDKKKPQGTSAKYSKKYNDTAVSVLKAAYEYIDTLEFEERFSYLALSDGAYGILSQTTNQERLAEIEKWKNNTNSGHYGTFLSDNTDDPMGQYICGKAQNYTDVPDNELFFIVIFNNGNLTCFVGSENNIENLLYGEHSLISGKIGAAVTDSVENISLISDEAAGLELIKAAYDFEGIDLLTDSDDFPW